MTLRKREILTAIVDVAGHWPEKARTMGSAHRKWTTIRKETVLKIELVILVKSVLSLPYTWNFISLGLEEKEINRNLSSPMKKIYDDDDIKDDHENNIVHYASQGKDLQTTFWRTIETTKNTYSWLVGGNCERAITLGNRFIWKSKGCLTYSKEIRNHSNQRNSPYKDTCQVNLLTTKYSIMGVMREWNSLACVADIMSGYTAGDHGDCVQISMKN